MASRFIAPVYDVGSGIAPSSGAKLFFFETDGTTPKPTYTTAAATVANANPVIADSTGLFPDIYISGAYKITLQDKNGSQIYGLKDIVESLGVDAGAIASKTLAEAKADTSAVAGQVVRISDRADALFEYKTGQTPNTYNIVAADATGVDLVLKVNGDANVVEFGAVGDGVNDDTAAIQTALNYFGLAGTLPRGVVKLGKGTYKITSTLNMIYEVSLIGYGGRSSKIEASGDFAAISWDQSTASFSRMVKIKDIWFTGSGVGSGNANNTCIKLDHFWGHDFLQLENLYIEDFSAYGIETDQQRSGAVANCFQFSDWSGIWIKDCNIGILLGVGFSGESVLTNIIIRDCTVYAVEFGISSQNVGAQGLTFDNLAIGGCPIGVYFGAPQAGMIVFQSLHIEDSSDACVVFDSLSANSHTIFNQSWFATSPVCVRGIEGNIIDFNNCVWDSNSVGGAYIDLTAVSGFSLRLNGQQRVVGTSPTDQLKALDMDQITGSVARKSNTAGTLSTTTYVNKLIQTRGLSGENSNTAAKNLTGRIGISNGTSFVDVTLTRTEDDINYNVVATVDFTSGTPAFIPSCSIGNKTTTGFRVHFSSAAPAGGYLVNWMLMRSV